MTTEPVTRESMVRALRDVLAADREWQAAETGWERRETLKFLQAAAKHASTQFATLAVRIPPFGETEDPLTRRQRIAIERQSAKHAA
ncbi:MAG TPA: hypothetical protein VEF89_19995 [Solirubrobacteraceae bacterium]|nr:hypothetical protein [Solirubrobacteraceae bacterium]